jgi:phosphatidylinositol kinase/protein kinase (PI-3  family)
VQAVQGQLVLSKIQVFTHSEIGFFRSIGLRNENALQDTLRLLTLWFKFGAHDDVSQAMASGFSVVEVDTWLEVIPQVSTDQHLTRLLLNSLDHCSHTNSERQCTAKHQQSSYRSWKASPPGSHISIDCSFQVLQYISEECSPGHHGQNERTQPYHCGTGACRQS